MAFLEQLVPISGIAGHGPPLLTQESATPTGLFLVGPSEQQVGSRALLRLLNKPAGSVGVKLQEGSVKAGRPVPKPCLGGPFGQWRIQPWKAVWPEWPTAEGHLVVTKPCTSHSGMDFRGMELGEDYQSPFDFAAGVNKNYLYLSPSGNPSPPGSPVLQKFGN